ncbi:MAG: glycosyltransferase [Myxococcales bacterium]|nr:glycosyltransferase [Myxococcales bacterium]MBL0194037.1 glycosyltransferase [Myxococcales bacterium]
MLAPAAQAHLGPGLWVSVVVANYNRPELVRRLLSELAAQSPAVPPSRFEAIVVDDGSEVDVREVVLADYPFSLTVHRQANAGAARARQAGAELARGKVVLFLDDDMRVGPEFLEGHLALHDAPDTVVLGQLRPDTDIAKMPLFEKFFARMLSDKADSLLAGQPLRGHGVYTGNVSMDRELFLRVGGFDPQFRALEDEELGIRLEKAGARLLFSDRGSSLHGSDKTSLEKWLARSYNDGAYAVRVGRKHRDLPSASPFRHFEHISPISLPFLGLGLGLPAAAEPLAKLAVQVAISADKLGLERLGVAGATLVYGIQFYRGVRHEAGSLPGLWSEYRAFRSALRDLGPGSDPSTDRGGALADFTAAVREDHAVMLAYQGKYSQGEGGGSLPSDGVKKIGFQILVAYRLMRLFRARGDRLAAQFTSRLMRHLYASDIHWDAELAPGVMIVHGFGLAISHSAKVARGCILFQGVTLGFGNDTEGRAGAPTLQENVHVGVGATLYGPITVGESSKIMAGCVLGESVPARSLVEAPRPAVSARRGRAPA